MGLLARLRHQALGLAGGLVEHAGLLLLGGAHLLLILLAELAHLALFLGDAVLDLADDVALVLEVVEQALDADVVLAEDLPGAPEDDVGKAEPGGDEERVGLARDAHDEPEGRRQRAHVELHGGVHEAVGLAGVDLQVGEVRGDDGDGAGFVEVVQEAHAERAALGGVGARAELVEEHQGAFAGVREDAQDLGDVAREGGQVLRDALLVADVGPDLVQERDGRARRARDGHAAAGHQAQQAERLEADGLAAGVGAGDDQRPEAVAHLDGDGDGRDALVDEQRMARGGQPDGHVIAHLRKDGADLEGIVGHRGQGVEVAQLLAGHLEVVRVVSDEAGEGVEDGLDLLLLGQLVGAQLVAELQHGERLHEDGRAAGGLVDDEAGELALVLGLHGHDAAAVALRDDGLLEHAVDVGVAEQRIEVAVDLGLGLADVDADGPEPGAGGVHDAGVGGDGAADFALDAGELLEVSGAPGQSWEGVALLAQDTAEFPGYDGDFSDLKEHLGPERAAPLRQGDVRTHVVQASQRQAVAFLEHAERLGHLGLALIELVHVGGGQEGLNALSSRRPVGVAGHDVEHLAELQHAQAVFVEHDAG